VMTDAIITGLTRIPSLSVIGRYSTSVYKGKPIRAQNVAEDLSVEYVLQGSVQRYGDTLRVTVQLTDVANAKNLWSDKFDKNWEDLFALQDTITKEIMTAVQVELTQGEQVRAWEKGTDSIEAYIRFLHALAYWEAFKAEELEMARQLAEEAIALDPQFASAYGLLGLIHFMDVPFGRSKSKSETFRHVEGLAYQAISIDSSEPFAHMIMGMHHSLRRQYGKGVEMCRKAVDTDPNWAISHWALGYVLYLAGEYAEAIAEINRAIRLNPNPPSYYLTHMAIVKWATGQFDEAVDLAKKADMDPRRLGSESPRFILALAYTSLGYDDKARAEAQKLLELNPSFRIEGRLWQLPFKDEKITERMRDGLTKAGLS